MIKQKSLGAQEEVKMPVEPDDDNSDNSMIIPNEEDSGSGIVN